MKPVDAIREIRDEMIADAKVKADAMAKAAVRAEAEAMYKLAKNGMKREEIAALFECGVATVHRRIRLHTDENNIARKADGRLYKANKKQEEPKEATVEEKEEQREEVLLALPAQLAHEATPINTQLRQEATPISTPTESLKKVIAEGWKEGKTPEQVVVKRKWVARNKYRDWCKAHKDKHEAFNYFRVLNKRAGGIIDLNGKIDTQLQCKLVAKFPQEKENILRHATKFNIRFRR